MPLEVTYLNPDFPDGKVFNISGLGSFPNGVTVELTTEQEKSFYNRRKQTVREGLGTSGNIHLKGSGNFHP